MSCHEPKIVLNSAEVEIDPLRFSMFRCLLGKVFVKKNIPRALYGRFDPYVFIFNLETKTVSTLIIFQ